MAFREGRPNNGTAHEPGAMAYPSVSETLAGSPRRRTKVLPGTLPGGPTWIDSAACEAGSARIVDATTMRGASARCACCPIADACQPARTPKRKGRSRRERTRRHGPALMRGFRNGKIAVGRPSPVARHDLRISKARSYRMLHRRVAVSLALLLAPLQELLEQPLLFCRVRAAARGLLAAGGGGWPGCCGGALAAAICFSLSSAT